ncbi:UDP-N-acetylmuramoyl-L-alanyl-D-glutamate--2,6-diaminopimelate ligase [Rhodococcus sp. 24CO]|uniref:UDP-N-acetylmuramoyl-L-alanyl-D-glutamate--2, 6-diaminopimelate ligase n=1 Tax=Rhodococcus sp. 24CO TaxID=3117460 RepID=UPI003D327680
MSNRPSRQPTLPLAAVAEYLGAESKLLGEQGTLVVTGVCQDSRQVRPGDIYAALPGIEHHGGEFVAEAAKRGAVAVISDRPTEILPAFVVKNPRKILGPLAAWIYGDPSTSLDVYGVTGTNGKTSTAFMLEAGLAAAGIRTGIISGICIRGPDGVSEAERTTPEACTLQRTLSAFVDNRVDAVAMEASSHGLALHRINGTFFRVAAFTNLSRDHLDFHRSMTSYFESKAQLFLPERCARAVISVDDRYGKALAERVTVPRLTFSSHGATADVTATDIEADQTGTTFVARHGSWRRKVRLRLLGCHQVDNALTAIAALRIGGVDITAALDGIENLGTVPGRLESVELGQNFLAFVDYVHNAGAQLRLFPYLRALSKGKIIAVIGATGGRDPGKREPLGRTAGTHADIVIVTDEGPYRDDATHLRNDVATGARHANHAEVLIIPDRGDAIRTAVSRAHAGDIVVVAGRGNDHVMNYDGLEIVFDDREVLERALVECAK